jgi:tRNA(adenine34) deaminase
MDERRTVVTPDQDAFDEAMMREAIREAVAAAEAGEVPIGAVVVLNGQIIARGRNRSIGDHDPTAHAEIIALRGASSAVGNYRLVGATVYATIEPCAMCAGALVWARASRLVYGAPDPKAGAVHSLFEICTSDALNHRLEIRANVLELECRSLMQSFFRQRREAQRSDAEE